MPPAVSELVLWFDSSGWLGIVGLVLTLIGFTLTAVGLMRSASAAEQAKRAAAQAVEEVKKLKVITDLSTAGVELEEIKRHARNAAWSDLPERLTRVRKLLIAIKANNPEMAMADQEFLLDAIVGFNELEKKLVNATQPTKLNGSRINSQLIDQADRLVEIMARSL